MEALELTALSLSAILAGMSGNVVDTPKVTTHVLPVIAGHWEIDLQFPVNQLSDASRTVDIDTIQEDSQMSQDTYRFLSSLESTESLESISAKVDDAIIADEYNHSQFLNYSALEIEETRSSQPKEIISELISYPKTEQASNIQSSVDNQRLASTGNIAHGSDFQCRELYNFDKDNRVRVSSGQELTWGKYIVSYQEKGLPIIAMTTVYDNNEVDCSGNQVDQSGESMVAYLDYHESYMKWCSDSEGVKCHAYFNRIYP